jgi:ABC-type dipeptide/oligopeptide/nickel transport system ATPase subunit
MQEAGASLNPRFTAEEAVAEPLLINGWPKPDARAKAHELIAQAGLPQESAQRRAGQFSGGKRTRLALVRALALEPDLLILGEPFSSLDRKTQSNMLDLLRALHARRPFSTIAVLHDCKLAAAMTTRFLEIKAGKVVNAG